MEIVDNVIMAAIPGAMQAGLGNLLFRGSLAVSLAVAFVVTVPVNRWLIARGRGHAVVHRHHHAGRGLAVAGVMVSVDHASHGERPPTGEAYRQPQAPHHH
jgi:hypothetical protein